MHVLEHNYILCLCEQNCLFIHQCAQYIVIVVFCLSYNLTTKRWQPYWNAQMAWGTILSSASFNNFAGSGITIGSVDSVLWRGVGTCSWFTTMTLNTTDTTERQTNHYFQNKLQQLILFFLRWYPTFLDLRCGLIRERALLRLYC